MKQRQLHCNHNYILTTYRTTVNVLFKDNMGYFLCNIKTITITKQTAALLLNEKT